MKYLLLKLVEEAGELVVAAVKYRLHRTPATLRKLEGEAADVLAILTLLATPGGVDMGRVHRLKVARMKRETLRMEKR